MKKTVNDKLYYSISEVSRMTGLEQYVLRYWEKEFPSLNPKKNRGGNRLYTVKEIDLINRINHLRKEEGLTIAGTRNRLTMRRGGENNQNYTGKAKAKTIISRIKKDIEDILKYFP